MITGGVISEDITTTIQCQISRIWFDGFVLLILQLQSIS
jgi:hypothetical protein